MRNKRILAIGIALVMVLTSFGMAFAQTPQTVTLSLKAQDGSGQNGTATLTDIGGGKTRVVIEVTPGAAGVAQPAHIHDGSCGTADLKGVKYPLTSVTDGKSTTEVSVTIASLLAAPYAINIHKSPAEVAVYTSCSNITAAAAPSALPASGAGGAAESQNGIFGIAALATAWVLVMGATVVVLRRRAVK
jgi:hypothetical protein